MRAEFGGSWISRVCGIAVVVGLSFAPPTRAQQAGGGPAPGTIGAATGQVLIEAIEALAGERFVLT